MIALLLSLCLAHGASTEIKRAGYVLKVASKDQASSLIIDEADRLGGWFSSLNDDSVVLRVPTSKVDELQRFIEAQGLVADRSYSTRDVRREVAELTARRDARLELLEQYQGLIGTAREAAVLQIEREIAYLIEEIEGLEGQLRYLGHNATNAEVRVDFRFRDRRAQFNTSSSSFAWINTLDITQLTGDLRWAESEPAPHAHLGTTPPEGFSAYKLKRERRATSAEGVVWRTRAVRQRLPATLSFWTEAVREHLLAQGYTLLREQELTGATWLEFAVPVGDLDYAYAVAIRPVGRRLDLIEAGGPVEPYEAHREALEVAVKGALQVP